MINLKKLKNLKNENMLLKNIDIISFSTIARIEEKVIKYNLKRFFR